MGKQLKASDMSRLAVSRHLWKVIKPLFNGGGRRREALLWVVDGADGMFWEFRCAVRLKGPYTKPVLQSDGWVKYVKDKGLTVGDKISLEAAEHEFRGTRFVIRAQRLTADGNWVDV